MGELNTLPVSVRVAGRRIVIVGGGAEALNKARLALRTCARVVVVAPDVLAGLAALDIETRRRPFVAGDLDGAALVFVADEGPEGAAAIAAARVRRAAQCRRPAGNVRFLYALDHRTGAADGGDFVGKGEAPALARLVRARIEASARPPDGGIGAARRRDA